MHTRLPEEQLERDVLLCDAADPAVNTHATPSLAYPKHRIAQAMSKLQTSKALVSSIWTWILLRFTAWYKQYLHL